jgi:hypothetical protein
MVDSMPRVSWARSCAAMDMESTIYSSGLAPGAGLIWIEVWLPASDV